MRELLFDRYHLARNQLDEHIRRSDKIARLFGCKRQRFTGQIADGKAALLKVGQAYLNVSVAHSGLQPFDEC